MYFHILLCASISGVQHTVFFSISYLVDNPWMHSSVALWLAIIVHIACYCGSADGRLVCKSRQEASLLLYASCVEHVGCAHAHDLSMPQVARPDAGDVEYETERLARYAEDVGIMRAADGPVVPNRVVQWSWSAANVGPATHDLSTLWYYDSDTTTAIEMDANCTELLADTAAEQRRIAMYGVVASIVMEHVLYNPTSECEDMNQRAMIDPVTQRRICECQQDKVCGAAGSRHSALLIIVVSLAVIIMMITMIVLLFVAVRSIDARAIQRANTDVERKR